MAATGDRPSLSKLISKICVVGVQKFIFSVRSFISLDLEMYFEGLSNSGAVV